MKIMLLAGVLMLSCAANYHTLNSVPDPVAYYGGIYGRIHDTSKFKPVSGVQIEITGTKYTTTSDPSGNYLFYDLPAGSYTLQLVHPLHDTLLIKNVTLEDNQIVNLNIRLDLKEKEQEVSMSFSQYRACVLRDSDNTPSPEPESESETEPLPPYAISRMQAQIPKAASHNDNEEYPFYLDFLERFAFLKNVCHTNFEDRLIVQITDTLNRPIANQKFRLTDWTGETVWESATYANGENIVYKNIMIPKAPDYKLKLEIGDSHQKRIIPVEESLDRIIHVQMHRPDQSAVSSLDLVFILDTTGSMKDEIQQLKDTIYAIHHRILQFYPDLTIRIGFVCYRDKMDDYTILPFHLTDNFEEIDSFLNEIQAAGGGDMPEDIQTALEFTLHQIRWNPESVRLAFLMGDAPPHLDYEQPFTYLDAAKEANRKGIKMVTIGASGLNIEGEYIFRQIAALTSSEFMFLNYGETGESRDSKVAKVSHHTGSNYNVRNLDDLIVDCVQKELSHQLISPLPIDQVIPPKKRADRIQTRLDNIWYQIDKQIAYASFEKPNAILLPFDIGDSTLTELAGYLYEESLISLIKRKSIILLEREKLNTLLEERNLVLSGLTDQIDMSELPALLGADLVICGDVKRSGLDEFLFLRSIRCVDGEIIAAARIRI